MTETVAQKHTVTLDMAAFTLDAVINGYSKKNIFPKMLFWCCFFHMYSCKKDCY